MPFSIAWCTTLTGSRLRARAFEKPKQSVRSLTPSLPTDLMTTSTRERALQGGRDHRNPRPASIGTGGRLRSESPADFVGMRILHSRRRGNHEIAVKPVMEDTGVKTLVIGLPKAKCVRGVLKWLWAQIATSDHCGQMQLT